jgi:thioesterase domain-containing protein
MAANLQNPSHAQLLEALVSAWRKILQRPDAGPDSDFFDSGGDSTKALLLSKEIAAFSGTRIPLLALFEARTPASLAARLLAGEPFGISRVLFLRNGSVQPPVFFFHGLGSSVFELVNLLRVLDSKHPIYGLQAKGTDGLSAPFDTIEDMARSSLSEIRSLQPHGPYFLIGFSLGGLEAYEVARQLTASGEKIALLVLIESHPDIKHLAASQQLGVKLNIIKHHLHALSRLPLRKVFSYLTNPAERQRYKWTEEPLIAQYGPGLPTVHETSFAALHKFQPAPYPGALHFVKSASNTHFPTNPGVYWRPLVDKYEEATVNGEHLSVVRVHFDELAAVLSRYLRSADAEVEKSQ